MDELRVAAETRKRQRCLRLFQTTQTNLKLVNNIPFSRWEARALSTSQDPAQPRKDLTRLTTPTEASRVVPSAPAADVWCLPSPLLFFHDHGERVHTGKPHWKRIYCKENSSFRLSK